MIGRRQDVATGDELMAALADPGIGSIIVIAEITGMPGFRIRPGQALLGNGQRIRFAAGQDGVQLSADNEVSGLNLSTDPACRALYNDASVDHFGQFLLRDLCVTGCVRLLARDTVRSGHVEAHSIDIIAADARGYDERPKGYGVEVVAGAFLLWNQQADPAVTITADLTGLSVGRAGAPVRGSGVFISGAGDAGGRLTARRLETGAVFSDGGIAPGTPGRISGGVFTVHGAFVDRVCNRGPVTTYGANDMVIDNWGAVEAWVAEDKITSHGSSAIGFVNFGTINRLDIQSAIETFGQGARGFNVYDGTVRRGSFDRIVTHGGGAVGIQISQPVGDIVVRSGIETYGDTGESLVKGMVTRLSAIPLSIKPGGSARKVEITGGLAAHGAGVEAVEVHGEIGTLRVEGIAVDSDSFGKI
jgi:hypothetical protein